MEISKSKRTWIIIGAVLMTATVQLSSAGLNNTMYAILVNSWRCSKNVCQFYTTSEVYTIFGIASVNR